MDASRIRGRWLAGRIAVFLWGCAGGADATGSGADSGRDLDLPSARDDASPESGEATPPLDGPGDSAPEDAAVPGQDAAPVEVPVADPGGDFVDPGDGSADPGADPGDGSADPGADPGSPPGSSCPHPGIPRLAQAWVPPGFCAWTWADGLASPRGIEVVPDGDVLVVERGHSRVTVLWDDDRDGVSGPNERAPLAQAPGLNHGLAAHGGALWASSATTVYRWPYTAGDRSDLGPGEVVVRDIPAGGHATRTLAFDAHGRLYVSIGSAGNVDPDSSRARIRRFVVDAVTAGGIAFADGEVFADGLRNEVGIAFDAAGRLWGVENGVDNLARPDLGGDIHQDNPAEELNLFAEPGHFYGYPYCWSEFRLPEGVGGGPGTQWAHPNFQADGTHDDAWCRNPANVVPPRLAMKAHSAPLDIVFYDGASFPAAWRGDAFVTFHGSWNANPPTGYKVVRVVFGGGAGPLGADPFLEYAGEGDTGEDWPHRPVGVRVAADGGLRVTSDASGVVIGVGRE